MRSQTPSTPVRSPVNFECYAGEELITHNGTLYRRKKEKIGEGVWASAALFETDAASPDKTTPIKQVTIKTEKPDSNYANTYSAGFDFQHEAKWAEKIYGKRAVGFSGDPSSTRKPHYILMPYIEGDTLAATHFDDFPHLVLHWIEAAKALNVLHTQYHGVHLDITAQNIVAEHKDNQLKVNLIDFGLTASIGESVPVQVLPNLRRNATDREKAERAKTIERDAPELYRTPEQKNAPKNIKAHPTQDSFRFGYLIWDLFNAVVKLRRAISAPDGAEPKINFIADSLKAVNPASRFTMQQTISVLHCLFLTGAPERSIHMTDMTALNQISAHRLVLQMEIIEKDGATKQAKIDGLYFIVFALAHCSLTDAVAQAKVIFPALTAGVFSRRTAKLLDAIQTLQPQ